MHTRKYLPLNFCRTAWRLCTLWGFSAPAAPAKTPLFTAREPLWRSKWPLGPARVLLSALKGYSGPALAPPECSKWPLWPALVPPVRSKRLLKRASMLPVRSKLPFWPALVPPVRSKNLLEPTSVPLSALKEAVRACCSRSLFESAGLGYTLL